MNAPLSDFLKFIGTDFERYILPIIPVGAKLKEESKINPGQLGKIPGRWLPAEGLWVGFGDWPRNYWYARASSLKAYQRWQTESGMTIAVGMNTRTFNVVDIDSDSPEMADTIEDFAIKYLGTTPVVRLRHGSSRRVLVYEYDQHTAPIRKHRLAFTDANGAEHAVEFLAEGQQVVIEGPHAKGQMHYWRSGGLVENRAALGANLIKADMVETLFRAMREWVENTEGLERVTKALPSSRPRGPAVKVEMTSVHVASDKEILAKAIKAININDSSLDDYDTWCLLFRAMWAACGGDHAFYAEHILPWLLDNPENDEGDMEAKRESFRDSIHGADFVYEWAARFGFDVRAQEIFRDQPLPFGGNETALDSAASGTSLAAVAPNLGGQNGGGGGPVPLNDTHLAIAEGFIRRHGDEWRYNTDARRWVKYGKGIWIPDDTILHEISDLTQGLSRQVLSGPNGSLRSRMLESAGTLAAVRNILQARKEMVVRDDEFDADPHLLNTPDFVIDLRTREFIDHSSKMLMRQQTLVSPASHACDLARDCPRFLSLLLNIADGREWVIPALQCWFGYCLMGEIRHHGILFIQGAPGIGKTQVLQVLFEILNTYAMLLTDRFLAKSMNADKRFDMQDIIGKRMLFKDETMLGMSWDEARMSDMASGKMLSAELKFGRTIKFPNTGKICISGNSRPHFTAGEAGGLTSRMLLLEAGGKPIRGTSAEIVNYAGEIVAQEGSAILMWALEAAVADYAPGGHTWYQELTREMREAAQSYTRENSILRQWVEMNMRIHPDADIDTMEAFERFTKYASDRHNNTAARMQLSDFKQGLKAAFPEIEFAKRTTRPHPNRSFIKGLGYQTMAFSQDDKVVLFPFQKES